MKTISYVEMSKPFYQFPYRQKNRKHFFVLFCKEIIQSQIEKH